MEEAKSKEKSQKDKMDKMIKNAKEITKMLKEINCKLSVVENYSGYNSDYSDE